MWRLEYLNLLNAHCCDSLHIDFLHTGSREGEDYVDGVFLEAQSDPHLVAKLDSRGEYRWTVWSDDKVLLASRGFSSLFEEWQSTIGRRDNNLCQTFRETLVVPWYLGATLKIERRSGGEHFKAIYEAELDAVANLAIAQMVPPSRSLRSLYEGGRCSFLILSEGYSRAEEELFIAEAERACAVILSASPYRELLPSISVSALFVPSRNSGIPKNLAEQDTTNFNTAYGILGMERYLVSTNMHAVRRAVFGIHYSTLVVMANASAYGGSGIFNSHCCVPGGMAQEDLRYVLLHELGHSLGGLGDEYFTSPVSYLINESMSRSPWEPNISSLDLQGRVKWSELIRPDIPVPTPWSHAEYLALSLDPSSVSEVGSHQAYVTGCARDAQENLLNHETFKGEIGAFEGAHYLPFGLYRPEVDCRMFSKTSTHYCTVCEETIRYSIEDTSM